MFFRKAQIFAKGYERMNNDINMNNIPHYIHYCWFGKEMPNKYKKYIESWHKFFPDYEIIKWDENNFPINEYPYAMQALQAKKMAFVSDVARMYALEKYGGIYFDTDVEVIKSFDDILTGKKAVLGTETQGATIGTGFMAFCQHNIIPQTMLEYYKKHDYSSQDAILSNTIILAGIIEKLYGFKPLNIKQENEDVIIYPNEYFTAYDEYFGKLCITDNTCCIHHFAASWFSPYRKMKDKIRVVLHRMRIL